LASGGISPDRERAAGIYLRARLNGRGDSDTAASLIAGVTAAAAYGPGPLPLGQAPAVTVGTGDIAAAMTLTGPAAVRLELNELRLICHGLARGMRWADIGTALGYDTAEAARARYYRLRGKHPAWPAPRPRAARWATLNRTRLRAAVAAVAAARTAIGAAGILDGAPVTAGDLAAVLAADPEPAVLYWAAYAAVQHAPASTGRPGGRAVAALRDLVAAP
jgi:hypothetical protein